MLPIDIFEFEDSRVFVKAYYDHRKQLPESFSYRRFSKLIGSLSPNFIKLIVDGQRNLTVENIYRMAQALELSSQEHAYFEAMVLQTQESDSRVKDYYKQRMLALKTER